MEAKHDKNFLLSSFWQDEVKKSMRRKCWFSSRSVCRRVSFKSGLQQRPKLAPMGCLFRRLIAWLRAGYDDMFLLVPMESDLIVSHVHFDPHSSMLTFLRSGNAWN